MRFGLDQLSFFGQFGCARQTARCVADRADDNDKSVLFCRLPLTARAPHLRNVCFVRNARKRFDATACASERSSKLIDDHSARCNPKKVTSVPKNVLAIGPMWNIVQYDKVTSTSSLLKERWLHWRSALTAEAI
jgi:hypothetical protein